MNTVTKRNRMSPTVFQGMWDEDFFNAFFGGGQAALPAVNVVEKDKEFSVDLSAPGFDKGDIKIEIDKNFLKISAEHQNNQEKKDEEGKIVRQEFSSSSFERSFVLPENIDTENIEAKHVNGILKIRLPKKVNAPEDLVKKISVE